MACLLLVRLPSLVQPAGADQGLYAYVGTRILEGELPYRDAWDQKPPAIHFTYAVMYGLWSHDSVVAAADLAMAAAIAWMLVHLGSALTGGAAAGRVAAVLCLLLGDPTLTRLAGVRVRSQCETFIAAAVTAALLLAVRYRVRDTGSAAHHGFWRDRAHVMAVPLFIGLLLGLAVTFKYNAIVYVPVVLIALALSAGSSHRLRVCFIAGTAVLGPLLMMILVFAVGSALNDLYLATIRYNLEYSGETYTGMWSSVRYLFTFPIRQARIDSIWTLGGLGCLLLIANAGRRDANRRVFLPVLWVCAACLSIAINGSRGLPQYFVQAVPALSLAGGVAAALLWPAPRLPPQVRNVARLAGVLIVSIAAWRVTDFDKIPRNAFHDLAYMTRRISPDEHLSRYGGRLEDKYVALSVARLAEYLKMRTNTTDRIYVFGFSPGAYVQAERVSASRFFWSRPVIVGFNAEDPRYGATGVLNELRAHPPAYVVLQNHDWAPPPNDSTSFFLGNLLLGAWLTAGYSRVDDLGEAEYEIWVRKAPPD